MTAGNEHGPKKVVPRKIPEQLSQQGRDLLTEVEEVLQQYRGGFISGDEADTMLMDIIVVGLRYP